LQAALKWKHCDAIHDTQALKPATDNSGKRGNHQVEISLKSRMEKYSSINGQAEQADRKCTENNTFQYLKSQA